MNPKAVLCDLCDLCDLCALCGEGLSFFVETLASVRDVPRQDYQKTPTAENAEGAEIRRGSKVEQCPCT
jgi:hypothetical protein